MQTHKKFRGTAAASAALTLALLLGACGGGGGGSTPSTSGSSTGGTSTGSGAGTGTTTGGSTNSGSTTGSTGSGSTTTTTASTTWDYVATNPSRSACGTDGTTYHVGDGQAYAELGAVPWGSLVACDQVLIHYRSTPYRSIVYLPVRGAANRFITIRGVLGPNGERPIIDGDGAVDPASSGLNPNGGYTRGGLFVMGLAAGNNRKSGYLHITGLAFRNARPNYNISAGGSSVAWGTFTSAIYAAPVEQMAVTNCEFSNNSMGIFVNSTNGESAQSRGLLIANNYFHDNGISGNFSVHHSYTEAIGSVYEYNYFGPMVSGSGGDGVKERSAGVIFRYNHFAGGTYMISLRDPESNEEYESAATDTQGDLLIKHAFVYKNRFVSGPATSVVVGHGDGTFGRGAGNRFGNLFFYGNEVVSRHDWDGLTNHAAPLFQLLNTDTVTTVRAYNNLFYATSATTGGTPSPLALFAGQGLADFQSNWINNFINNSGSGFNGTGLNGLVNQATSPGITNLTGGDYTLLSTSPYFSLNATLPTEVTVRGLAPQGSTMPVATPFTGPSYGS